VPCTVEGRNLYFTIDPLDGTKAFMRRQSSGVGTQIALVEFKKEERFWEYEAGRSGQVLAAYVGDVCTQEIYGFRPDSTGVYRISEFEYPEPLHTIDRDKPLGSQNLQLREMPEDHYPLIAAFAQQTSRGGLFKDVEVGSGSIGIMFSRLWKGEVGAVVLPAGKETPWDTAPVVGITEALGFVGLTPNANNGFDPYILDVRDVVYRRDEEVLFVHKSRVSEVQEWTASRQ
jgi:fructose-1,6-bisphosphatase/inositol monophosphatase family enzyme